LSVSPEYLQSALLIISPEGFFKKYLQRCSRPAEHSKISTEVLFLGGVS
jgi:hypothetical protein